MSFADVLDRIRERKNEKKELMKQMDNQMRVQEILEDRKKSANERELERFMKENREKEIDFELKIQRKTRQDDINFNHNPLNTPNITNKTQWEVLKEKNMFRGGNCMFSNQTFIHRNNPNMFRNNMRLLR